MTVRLLIILLIFSSCATKLRVPDYVIKQEKMQDILRDMIKADALAQEIALKDSSKDLKKVNLELYNNVFALYSITPGKFDTSYSFYEKNPSLMYAMFDTLNKRQSLLFKEKDRKYNPDSTLKAKQ